MNELLTAWDAAREADVPAFTYTVERAGVERRVRWAGGMRNGTLVPSGDVFTPADATYDRLLAALEGGGFMLGGQVA